MKAIFHWEPEMGFFIIPTITLDTYNSPNFGKDWPRVFGITFLWLKFQLCFKLKKSMSSPVDETVRLMKKIYDNSFHGKMVDVCDIYRFYDSKLAEEITETGNEMMEEFRKRLIEKKK